jgi:hypothetical protein
MEELKIEPRLGLLKGEDEWQRPNESMESKEITGRR